MYTLVKKQYPNTTIWQHATKLIIEHPAFLICETPKDTAILTPQGFTLSKSEHRLIYLSSQEYYIVSYSRSLEERVAIHFASPFWRNGSTLEYVEYELVIRLSNRSCIIDELDMWHDLSKRLPEPEASRVNDCFAKTMLQLAQNRFPPLDVLRDVFARL